LPPFEVVKDSDKPELHYTNVGNALFRKVALGKRLTKGEQLVKRTYLERGTEDVLLWMLAHEPSRKEALDALRSRKDGLAVKILSGKLEKWSWKAGNELREAIAMDGEWLGRLLPALADRSVDISVGALFLSGEVNHEQATLRRILAKRAPEKYVSDVGIIQCAKTFEALSKRKLWNLPQ
jgi:hypothetical protein